MCMTPRHPRWREFIGRLHEALAPEFDEDGNLVRWRCAGNHRHTVEALHGMGLTLGETDDSLRFFNEHGGHCDCEVMFNVVALAAERRELTWPPSRR
jgi:Protein of unknown function (DUF2695)